MAVNIIGGMEISGGPGHVGSGGHVAMIVKFLLWHGNTMMIERVAGVERGDPFERHRLEVGCRDGKFIGERKKQGDG